MRLLRNPVSYPGGPSFPNPRSHPHDDGLTSALDRCLVDSSWKWGKTSWCKSHDFIKEGCFATRDQSSILSIAFRRKDCEDRGLPTHSLRSLRASPPFFVSRRPPTAREWRESRTNAKKENTKAGEKAAFPLAPSCLLIEGKWKVRLIQLNQMCRWS